jgi:hypothetical protein
MDRTEALGIALEQLLDGPLGQGLGGVDGDLLEGVKIDPVGGSILAEGAACDDFTPVLGQVTDLGGSGRWGFLEGHRMTSLGLGKIGKLGNSS